METQPTPHILPGSPEATAALQRWKRVCHVSYPAG
jgi:hypothetical protein